VDKRESNRVDTVGEARRTLQERITAASRRASPERLRPVLAETPGRQGLRRLASTSPKYCLQS
jgi:hypothetical protein